MQEVMRPQPRDLRRFGLIAGSIVAVLFGALLPWLRIRIHCRDGPG
jgi:hypothetical protein